MMKKLLSILLCGCMLATMLGCTQTGADSTSATTTAPTEQTDPKNTMTGEELMQEMKIGWNLGNTFDAPDGETSWGNPITTQELIQFVYDQGFRTIRIPISWHKHVSAAPDYTIDESWMARVEQVINYALDLGMYVIINSHHDNNIYYPAADNQAAGQEYLTAIWAQIAEHFKDYDHHLIFQTMNEPRIEGTSYEWSVNTKNEDCMAAVEVINQYNQAIVDEIRATGSYNAERWIIVSAYCGNYLSSCISAFHLPTDPANKLIVSVHAYSPYNLCLNTNSDVAHFSKADYADITTMMKAVNRMYVQNGIPVIIDEMGCLNKENDEARYEWAKYYVSQAKNYGLVCCWWDNGTVSTSTEGFGIINRRDLSVYPQSERVLAGLMEGLTVTEE